MHNTAGINWHSMLLIASLAVLTACANSHSYTPFTPAPVADGESIIFVYRPQKMANAIHTPELIIDGEARGGIRNGEKYQFHVTPGSHEIALDPAEEYAANTSVGLATEAGTAYYLRVDTTLELDQGTGSYSPYIRSFDLFPITRDVAVEQISECCMKASKSAANARAGEATGDEEKDPPATEVQQGFSSDKTGNPFGH